MSNRESLVGPGVRNSDPGHAIEVLEGELAECRRGGQPMPSWLCGRLASLYRAAERFDDEVQLLEEYQATGVSEKERKRYDARLTKARTLAERHRRSDNGAVASVRDVQSRVRRTFLEERAAPAPDTVFSTDAQEVLLGALTSASAGESELLSALERIHNEARAAKAPIDTIVLLFKELNLRLVGGTTSPGVESRYRRALVHMLSTY